MKRKFSVVHLHVIAMLSLLSISASSMAQNVMTPSDTCYKYNSAAPLGSSTNPVIPGPNVLAKWVHDPSQNHNKRSDTIGSYGFDQSTYKCYFWGKTAFRLRFPNNYDPANPAKYPLIIFLHGAGEAASDTTAHNAGANRENQDQLYWGAQLFEKRMNQGEWNGFMLFPQLMDNSPQWDNSTFPDINNILDTLQKYNGFDPDRVIAMGLSAGGYGSVNYANYYPQRISSVISANPRFIETLIDPSQINGFLQIPIYMACGGIDNFPGPAQVLQFRDSFATKGGNIYLGYNATLGHASWQPMWAERDIKDHFVISTYWNAAHKAQPLLYYQNNQFCADSAISAPMGITAGFYVYEWQYDGGGGFTTIAGATSNMYTATSAGSYRVHFKRTSSSDWSAWTPSPIIISTKACTLDTAFVEHFETNPINPYTTFSGGPVFGNSAYYQNNFTCQNGIFVNSTEAFTQDASGHQGGTFMMNNTTSTGCTYYAGDQVWHNYNPSNVLPNTNYVLNFYVGNNATVTLNYFSGSTVPGYTSTVNSTATPVAQLIPKINGVALTATAAQTVMQGNISWKKFSYVWNSGNSTSADIAITNNTTNGAGNDFVLDEISLVKYYGTVMPAGVNTTLWSKAGTVVGNDLSPVSIWTNSDVNSNNLLQNVVGTEPVLKNNATDNINFNPVVAYNPATSSNNFVSTGFSGSATHTSAHVYIVTKANSTATGQTLLSESQSSGILSLATGSNATLTWNAGSGLTTPNNANETGKPILWTFSKDNTNNTGDGNKQDIRKNGVLIASSSSTTTFRGNNKIFRLGYTGSAGTFFNGSIAEVIYLLDTSLNAATENKIESYLAVKYGTTLGYKAKPVAYTASDATVIWPANTSYQTDVFGIGADSTSGLVQTSSNSANSGSGDGTGQSAKGNLVLSADTVLANKQFLMIGNDSAALSQTVINANPTAAIIGSTRLTRTWKVANTGGIGAVDLSFDTTGLGNLAGGSTSGNYMLMIDNDGDGNFNTGTLSFFTATSASGKKINFSGVTLNNNIVFTIVTMKSATLLTLPATWLSFTAEAFNGNALLNWKTSDEINVDNYTVEHSFNGVSFSAVGSVNAYNNSGVNEYTFTHTGLAFGLHYYRIRRTDKDGRIEYSDIKIVKIATDGANVQVRPNPVTGSTLKLFVSVQKSSQTTVNIISVNGRVLAQQNVNLSAGDNFVNLNISIMPAGIYLVQMQLNDELITKKFIRQ